MHVRVRAVGKPDTIVVLDSKLTKIEQFRRIIKDKFQVETNLQRLFYGGKLLENGYTFHDYNIKLNDVIQLIVKVQPDSSSENTEQNDNQTKTQNSKKEKTNIVYKDAKSNLYEVGDLIDAKDKEQGAWFEATIVRIVHDPDTVLTLLSSTSNNDDDQVQLKEASKESDSENMPPYSQTDEDGQKLKKKGIAKYFTKSVKKKSIDHDSNENKKNDHDKIVDTDLLFKVHYDGENEENDTYCKLKEIRPRARSVIDIKDLKVGEKVMINHNTEQSSEKGYWFDFTVKEIKKLRTSYELIGTLYLGAEAIPQDDTVKVHDSIFKIEEPVPLEERTEEYRKMMAIAPEKRSAPLNCMTCRDDDETPCKDCGCFKCLGKENPEKIVLCDECNNGYHMQCLTPPLTELPEDDWYCPSCKRNPNEVIAPGAAKQSKKASASKRDWGRGMACVGKTKTCAMPANHFGPIPGIEVGMCWRFRIQLSESGVHRPPVSGIHGRDVEGAYSIVLSGGYEDDVDNGNEFTYTGSGGRDLSGNKRTAEQSCDQTLTRENKALARNCAVKVISESGADAGENWREGKPVRVVRSYKMLKHFPKYAPKEGIRYDGIYKVVKYYPENGLSGFRVWKYLLRRDDPSPAPWEPGAKRYSIIYPDGYLEAEAEKKALKEKNSKSVSKKRALRESNQASGSENEASPPGKKRKTDEKEAEHKKRGRPSKNSKSVESPKVVKVPSMFSPKAITKPKTKPASSLNTDERDIINADSRNAKLWQECLEICESKGKKDFVEHITQVFLCIICQDVTVDPVTTPCLHNFCKACLKLAFKSTGAQSCPCCRQKLSEYEPVLNEQLQAALRTILPGYDAGKK